MGGVNAKMQARECQPVTSLVTTQCQTCDQGHFQASHNTAAVKLCGISLKQSNRKCTLSFYNTTMTVISQPQSNCNANVVLTGE